MMKKFFAVLFFCFIWNTAEVLAFDRESTITEFFSTDNSIKKIGFSSQPEEIIFYFSDQNGNMLKAIKVEPEIGLDFHWYVSVKNIDLSKHYPGIKARLVNVSYKAKDRMYIVFADGSLLIANKGPS